MQDSLLTTPQALYALIGSAHAPLVFDVRRREAFQKDDRVLPAARWQDHTSVDRWGPMLPRDAAVVVYCVHGHQVSQSAVAAFRARGIRAQALEGGIEAWRAAGLPTVRRSALPALYAPDSFGKASRWITRIHPKIDRIACPWLIRRFIDPDAQFLFVASDQVAAAAKETGAIPYDIEGVELTHEGDRCSFDTLLRHFDLRDPRLDALALIVRGADTGHLQLAPEAAGLLAISLGISALNADDDHVALAQGALIYDALLAWAGKARGEAHGWPPRKS